MNQPINEPYCTGTPFGEHEYAASGPINDHVCIYCIKCNVWQEVPLDVAEAHEEMGFIDGYPLHASRGIVADANVEMGFIDE